MPDTLLATLIFVLLAGSALFMMAINRRLPDHFRHDETGNVVRLIANIFVVMTSLVLGLMINSAKNTFEAVDHNVHAISTEMILLDRDLRSIPGSDGIRQQLLAYCHRAQSWARPTDDHLIVGDRTSEQLLTAVGTSLRAVVAQGADATSLLEEARLRYRTIVALRWSLVEDAEGAIPILLIAMVVAWLVLIFASFGYRAPKNIVVVGSFVVATGLIAASIYLILDMDAPFSGPIQVSDEPLQRAIAEMQR